MGVEHPVVEPDPPEPSPSAGLSRTGVPRRGWLLRDPDGSIPPPGVDLRDPTTWRAERMVLAWLLVMATLMACVLMFGRDITVGGVAAVWGSLWFNS